MMPFNCDACRDYGGKEVRDGHSHTFVWELCPYCNPKADDYPMREEGEDTPEDEPTETH